jgi:peptide/nickel transport system ATP-binding protein
VSALLLEVRELVRTYAPPRQSLFSQPRRIVAVGGVSFRIFAGRSFGIVGESGAGKSTLARAVMALDPPTSGSVAFLGEDLFALAPLRLRKLRARMQMVFQDPFGSLDPRQRVGRIVAEPLSVLESLTARQRRARVDQALVAVGLSPADAERYPHEFSGGQRQRIAIARALITRPSLVVADEPVSALDVSVQAQVLNLMNDLARDNGVTYLLVSHDLAVVANVCEDLAVMFEGRFVEIGPAALLLKAPSHPYMRALIDAAPRLTRDSDERPSETPAPNASLHGQRRAGGCAYAGRCEFARELCREAAPALASGGAGRSVACHFPIHNQ